MTRKSVAVHIAGNDYKILSDGDEESILQTARYVDRAMNDIRERTGTVDTLGVSVLTCLNLARELLALRERQNATVEDGRLRALIDRVERAIEGEDAAGAETEKERMGSADVESAEGRAESRSASREGLSGSDPASAGDGGDSEGAAADSARTLALPSVESRRERAAARSEESADPKLDEPLPEARVAASGRERAG